MATSVSSKQNKGFTIIETVLVLAISSLLLLIIFLGQGGVTQRARFTDSVEHLQAQLETIRDSVNNTVVEQSGPGGVNPNRIMFGKVVTFNNNIDTFTVQTLQAAGPGSGAPGATDPTVRVVSPSTLGGPKTYTTRWGLVPNVVGGNIPKIAFVRHAGTGKLETHIISAGNGLDASHYTGETASAHYVLGLRSPEGYKAELMINPVDARNSIRVNFD